MISRRVYRSEEIITDRLAIELFGVGQIQSTHHPYIISKSLDSSLERLLYDV
jgi:hypothetical protein